MQKFLAVLAAAVVAAVAAAPAGAAPAKFASFNESVAATGAHAYARTHLGGSSSNVVTAECAKRHPNGAPRAALWVCSVETFVSGTDKKPVQTAVVGVLRKGGSYIYRSYDVVEKGGEAR